MFKRIVATAALGVAALFAAAAGAWFLVDDATLVSVLDRELQAATGLRIGHQGEARITRSLSPMLTVKNLQIDDQRAGYRVESTLLRVQLSLPRLLLGQLDIPLLQLGDTRITLTQAAPAGEPQPDQSHTRNLTSLPLQPRLRDVQIGTVSVVRNGGEWHLPAVKVDEIAVDLESQTETLRLSARVGVAEKLLQIEVKLPDIFRAVQRQTLAVSLEVNGPHLALDTDGSIALDTSSPAIDANIRASSIDLATFPVGIDGLAIPGKLTARARLAGPLEHLALQNLAAEWRDTDNSGLTLEGGIEDVTQLEGIQLALAGKLVKPLWLKPLLPDSIGDLEGLAMDARVSGAYRQLTVNLPVLQVKTTEGLDLSLDGQFDTVNTTTGLQPRNFALQLKFEAPTTHAARALLFDQVPELGAIHGEADVHGDGSVPGVENIAIETREKPGVAVDLKGSIAHFPLDPDQPNSGYDLDVVMKTAIASNMAKWAGVVLPLKGPARLEYRIEGATQALALTRIRLNAGEEKGVLLDARGEMAFGDWAQPDPLRRVDLQLHASSRDSASAAALVGRSLPELGALSADAHLHTVSGRHRIDNLDIRTGKGAPLDLVLAGTVGEIRFFPNAGFQDVAIKAQATARDAAQLKAVFDLPVSLPAIGPVVAQARIGDKDGRLAVDPATVRIGDAAAPVVQATGYVNDLSGSPRTSWNVGLNLDTRVLSDFTGANTLPDAFRLAGKLLIDNSDGPLGIRSLELRSSPSDDYSFLVKGRFADFTKPETLALTASLTARDLQSLGAAFHRQWPAVGPVQLNSVVRQAGESTDFDTRLSAGNMRVHAAINAMLSSKPVKLSGRITGRKLFIMDFFTNSADEKDASKKAVKEAVFPRTPLDFSWLNKADLDLAVNIASFDDTRSTVDSATLGITLKDGHLAVSPATLVYPKGKLALELQVYDEDPPRMSFKARGDNLDPWKTLRIREGQNTLDTDVDVDVDITTSGASAHELAGNLNGNAYVVMKNGKILRTLLDAMLLDPVGWTIGKTLNKPYYDIDCGVADYSALQGVVATNAFLLDTKGVTVSGSGTIDLGREQIDYVVIPKKKLQLIGNADPVKITGALNDPKVRVLPWKTAAATTGGLVFAPYIFAGIVAADYLSNALDIQFGKKSSPCEDYEKKHPPPDTLLAQ